MFNNLYKSNDCPPATFLWENVHEEDKNTNKFGESVCFTLTCLASFAEICKYKYDVVYKVFSMKVPLVLLLILW